MWNSIVDTIERTANRTKELCVKMGYKKTSAFMHIPKCAGSSIISLLRENRKSSWAGHIDGPKTRQYYTNYFVVRESSIDTIEREVNLYKFRQSLLIKLFLNNNPIISGHVPFLHSLKKDYPQYAFISVVRNPLNRLISCFNFGLVKNQHSQQISDLASDKGIDYAFDAFLDSPIGQFEANALTLFFSECGKYNYNLQDAQKRAINGISIFDYIGITEDLSEFQNYLHSQNIIPKHRFIKKHNVTENLTKRSQLLSRDNLTIAQKSNLAKLCHLDLELYEFIKDRYR